jgi:hypothetical protein
MQASDTPLASRFKWVRHVCGVGRRVQAAAAAAAAYSGELGASGVSGGGGSEAAEVTGPQAAAGAGRHLTHPGVQIEVG